MSETAAKAINPYTLPGLSDGINIKDINTYTHSLVGLMPNPRTRQREFVIPRQVAMSVAYIFSGKSLFEIGLTFGRDHATVIHAIKAMDTAFFTKDHLVIDLLETVFEKFYEAYRKMWDLKAIITDEDLIKIKMANRRINQYYFSRSLMQKFANHESSN